MSTARPSLEPARRRILHGRRRGRPLSARRRQLLATVLPYIAVAPEARPPGFDARTLFEGGGAYAAPTIDQIWLEVGFGAGEHLAAQAAEHPDIGFVGCEPYLNGVAAVLARIDEEGLANIRVHPDDARAVIERLGAECISRVFVLFPDPWPKARHARRRFISRETLDLLARMMTDGAELRIASDDMGYIRWALAALLRHPDFTWCAERPDDWRRRPADQPATRYERKARADGITPVFLVFRRRDRKRNRQKA